MVMGEALCMLDQLIPPGPGLTLVTGPNGSGKSSAARALAGRVAGARLLSAESQQAFYEAQLAADESNFWRKVCQCADCRAGAVEGAFFQGMTKTEKEQKQCAFGKFTERRRAERRHDHQQVSIEMFLFNRVPGVL